MSISCASVVTTKYSSICLFKAPAPMTPWQSTVMAFDDGPRCPQPAFMIEMPDANNPQSEQCLYMNIFTPKLVSIFVY